MTAAVMRLDLEACEVRTRWTMSVSVVLHVLIMLWIALVPAIKPDLQALTEITLIEPGDLGAGSPTPSTPAPAPRTERGTATSNPQDESFRRLVRGGEITPEPESPTALDDRLQSRLATLQRDASTPVLSVQVPSTPSALWGAPAVGPSGEGTGGSARIALHRGGGGSGPALQLTRGGGHGTALATVASAGLPAASKAAANPARGGDATARRSLAGATLMGPIADRPVLAYTKPIYPDWAKRDGVEGSVTLYFVVRSDGSIKENILVQKTAGFEDFDESARNALRVWQFAPLSGGRTGEQWGTITLHFRLREAG